jgi:hypothetical protein
MMVMKWGLICIFKLGGAASTQNLISTRYLLKHSTSLLHICYRHADANLKRLVVKCGLICIFNFGGGASMPNLINTLYLLNLSTFSLQISDNHPDRQTNETGDRLYTTAQKMKVFD